MVERDESRRGAAGEVAPERTAWRLLVARLRARIARLEGGSRPTLGLGKPGGSLAG